MSTTPVSNISSPDQNAKEPEQSNKVKKRSKNIQTLSIFSSTNPLHKKKVFISSLKLILLNLGKINQYRVKR